MRSVVNRNGKRVFTVLAHTIETIQWHSCGADSQIQLSKDEDHADYLRKQAYFLYEVQRMLKVYSGAQQNNTFHSYEIIKQ